MNKNFYKTIFSKTRGEMIAVAENVSAAGQASTNNNKMVELETTGKVSKKSLSLKVLSFSLMLITGTALISSPIETAQANVIADPNAAGNQRPTIMNSANGTTQVNIQTPTQGGVSVNHYQQFDVNQNGVILNNSRQNTNTQLGGYIQGNPWLAGGEAKVIVNQVNSSNPSHLNGYVEVGGRKADVIIANQAGINVDGGGFINAAGVTLSTANPNLQNGQVTGYKVRDGQINITGNGLDSSKTDYTQILSRAASINAGIWANELTVVAGQNDIAGSAQVGTVQATSTSTGTAPKIAIDTSHLGGMYAGKINLISTEKGVGINNAGQVFASAGNIKISANGEVLNSGAVVAENKTGTAAAQLNIQTEDLTNTGKILSLGDQQIQAKNVKNTGLINSQGLTRIDASQSLQNVGTGQIYGDHIALQTAHLLNAEQQTDAGIKAATIAARQRLDLAGGKIENREQALIASEGTLTVGGKLNAEHQAEGSATSLDNASARIQSAGDMYLGVDTLTNRNLHFSSSVKEIPGTRKDVVEYQGDGSPNILDSSHITGWGSDETIYLDGQEYEDYTRYIYNQHETKHYVDSSAPAEIISGGTLTLKGDSLTNDKSQILAAKGINIEQNEVNNIDAEGEHRVIKTGTSQHHYVDWNSWGSSHTSEWDSVRPYNPADIVTPIKLDVVKYDGAYQGALEGDTSELSIPLQSLYSVNKGNNNHPLIETSDAFTNYKQWLGSDYMLQMFNTDPQNMHKRLGDGYYEQKLVNDQVAKLTGKVYLDGYSNFEDQFKALMDSGVSAAKDLNLSVGVKLSEAQIARLTSDIVWMVTETITVDGEKIQVLVPKVYVAVQPGDLNNTGALIAGESINLKLTGDLNNQGSIAGRQLVNLEANNINNVGGLIQGREVFATAQTDINNIGGQVQANKTLALDAGRDINNITTTIKTENKHGLSEFTAENIGRVAGLYVQDADGTLSAQAKNNINLTASDIQSQGSVSVKAGQDLNLSTVNVSRRDLSSGGDDNYILNGSSRDVGTQIQANGNIYLQSGVNTQITAGMLNSESGNVVVNAGKDIQVQEGRATHEYALRAHEERGNAVSKTRKDKLFEQNENTSVSSVITGKNVVLSADQNIAVQGSQVVADELAQLQAKGAVDITAATDTSSSTVFYSKEKSGFTASVSDGVASVGYGKSNTKQEDKSKSTSLTQSVVGSVNGNTNIVAGEDLNVKASIVESGKDINLIGKNVNLDAADVTEDIQSKYEHKSSGISIGVTYSSAAAAAASAKKSKENSEFSDSAVGKIISSTETVRKASMAAATPVVFQAHKQNITKTKDTTSSQVAGTEVKAGGNLNIIATEGDIRAQAAKISAEGDALLHAKNNIDLLAGQNTESQIADSKRSGFSIDTRDHLAPLGVYNDKEKANGGLVQSVGTELSVGGKTTIKADEGNINIVGSKVVSTDDLILNAGKDINIQSAQNSFNQSEDKKSKGWGSAQISDTERFDGYMASKNNTASESVSQERSQVGSLEGNVNITAGNNYKQKVADVVAGKDINITAKDISIVDDHNTGRDSQSSKDLKVGVFSRVSSPLLDLVNAVDKAGNSKADDRTQALQGLAAGAQAYQTANTINNVRDDLAKLAADPNATDLSKAALFKAETGIGFSTSKSNQDNRYSASQGNVLNAGGNINLTSTEGDIHLKNTQVNAKDTISLDSAKDILLESGQSTEYADGKNSNVGAQVGVGVSVGAQTGVYAYAEVGYGKGSNHLESTTHQNTTLNADQIKITSKGDTTLKGAQATANRIDADVGKNLNIISQQDTLNQDSKQMGVGARVQVSAGSAWDASGNFNNSSAKGNSKQVNQQSGLFAGDGGYHVKADHVDLKGGAIASTATKDNNDLTANSLSFSNIENESGYKATTVALSGGTRFGDEKGTDSKGVEYTNNVNWRDSTTFSPTLPQQDKDDDSSTTYATLTAGNINIGGKETTVEELGIHSDINTANQKVDEVPDLNALLEKQKIIADATSTIVAATRTYSQNKQKDAEAQKQAAEQQAIAELEAKGGEDWAKYNSTDSLAVKQQLLKESSTEYKTASEQAQAWGMGGDSSRALNAVTIAITAALGGQTDLQAVSNALAPYAAQIIGQEFGHGEDKNTAAQLISHAILGATLAYINGGDPTAGGSAAVASEAAANYLTNQYKDDPRYKDKNGEFQPNLLPEGVKAQIRDLTAGIGAVIGGAVGDSSYNAQLAGVIGQNAVENNDFLLEMKFALKHPKIALQIGGIQDPSSTLNPNISTIASTYQLNLLNPQELLKLGYTVDEVLLEGSMGNALRHTLWQALITKSFGSNIAIEAGNAHESRDGTNYKQKTGLSLNKADELADQLNNQIGRSLGSNTLNNSDLAKKVLDTYANQGLYQAVKSSNGTYDIQRVKLNKELYEIASKNLKNLDQTGAGSTVQKKRQTLKENSNFPLTIGGTRYNEK